jgi:peptidoglycan/LPS O-acetylase OafA/YrhL
MTIVVLTASICIRLYIYVNIPILDMNDVHLLLRKQVITRLDSIMYGVIGAYICYYHSWLWNKFKLQVFAIGVCLFLFQKFLSPYFFVFNGMYQTVFSFAVTAIATLILLPFLNSISSGKGKLFELFTTVSLISYSMYLVNLTLVQRWIIDHIPWDRFIENYYLLIVMRYVLYWLLVIIISILLYRYFEKPMMKLRDNISR